MSLRKLCSSPISTLMDYLKKNLKWEDFFIQESVELSEKMVSFDMEDLTKSKVRLSLENKILDWEKYEAWVIENLGCSSLKNDIGESVLKNFVANSQQAYDIYSNHDFWSEDLLPIFIWENQLIVFGIEFNESLLKLDNHVFILAPPEVLSFFAKKVLNKTESVDELEEMERTFSKTMTNIEGLEMEVKPPSMDFKTLSIDTVSNFKLHVEKNTPSVEKNEATIWEFINERHDEYIYEVKKQFSVYMVLKIDYDMTKVFKMDPDLLKENINAQLFTYSLKEENPFKRVFETGLSESFNVSQLGLGIRKFKYGCITPLKRGDKVVGFLLGFKDDQLLETDQFLLEELAKESAS